MWQEVTGGGTRCGRRVVRCDRGVWGGARGFMPLAAVPRIELEPCADWLQCVDDVVGSLVGHSSAPPPNPGSHGRVQGAHVIDRRARRAERDPKPMKPPKRLHADL